MASNNLDSPFPIPLADYLDTGKDLWEVLCHRVHTSPFNLFALFLFLGAITHTLLAGYFRKKAHQWEEKTGPQKIESNLKKSGHYDANRLLAQALHLMGEVEVIFGLWLLPLFLGILCYYGPETLTLYLGKSVSFSEPVFVVVIMVLSATAPVVQFAESLLGYLARLGGASPGAWWLSILIAGPLLGSLITEPAAMTLSALLLARQFYRYQPSTSLKYATLGLLFVNISIGGTLTHFAAPPILMVADRWNWGLSYVFFHFGLEALLAITCSTLLYAFFFRHQLRGLKTNTESTVENDANEAIPAIPFWVTAVHLGLMALAVLSLHTISLVVGIFLVFLVFREALPHYHTPLQLRSPLLVGCFLAGLVVHGGLQSWWLAPLLTHLGEKPLFLGSTLLTAFNDNAAITYLASLVPAFADNSGLQHAVVAGAVTGGGLTVIANAPNPAGQAILGKYFEDQGGISPLKLLLSALIPTLIAGLWFNLLG